MNRPVRHLHAAIALLAVTAVGALTGCTAQPAAAPAAAATAKPATVQTFVCPELTEVAALTATPVQQPIRGIGGVQLRDRSGRLAVVDRHRAAARHERRSNRRSAAVRGDATRRS